MSGNDYNWELRKAIKTRGYTYKTLAEKSGIHYVHVCRFVIGKKVPKHSERVILSRILREPQKVLFKN